MPDTECSVCTSSLISVSGELIVNDENIQVYRCKKCGLMWLYPQPSDALLEEQYSKYFEKRDVSSGSDREEYLTWIDRQIEQVRGDRKKIASLLEIGAGEGKFLSTYNLRHPDCRLFGVEPLWQDADVPPFLGENYWNASVEEWLQQPSGRFFDALVMLDVLEHLRNPFEVLEGLITKNLGKDGIGVLTFPNADSLSRIILGKQWPQYKLEHLFYFSRSSIEIASDKLGVKTLLLRPNVKRYPIRQFLRIGAEFSPPLIRSLSSLCQTVIPEQIKKLPVSLYCGELLWIFQKES